MDLEARSKYHDLDREYHFLHSLQIRLLDGSPPAPLPPCPPEAVISSLNQNSGSEVENVRKNFFITVAALLFIGLVLRYSPAHSLARGKRILSLGIKGEYLLACWTARMRKSPGTLVLLPRQ
jgi:hypothetical protein